MPAGINVPPEVIRELGGIVGRCCQLCQAAIRSEGVKILELISRDPKSLSNTAGAESSQWLAALDAVQLTPSQQEQLLLLRRSHLDRMREIYAERQALNMEAMVLMLPHHSANPGEDNTVEGKMNNISTAGYLPVAKSNAELATVLDKIKNNLRREQRSVMDLNCCTISRIMNPVQAARYMITVYPRHCDALALSNVLAQKVGREGSFSRLASEALASSGSGAAVAVPAGGGCCGGTSACC